MTEVKLFDISSKFNLPGELTSFKTFKDYEETMEPFNFSNELILKNLNIENTSLVISKPSSSLFSVSNKLAYSEFKCPETWEPILNSPEAREELDRVYKKLQIKTQNGETICPKEESMFRAFEECKLTDLKVVIIGQDPYHKIDSVLNRELANGLSFSGLYGGENPNSMDKVVIELKRTWPDIKLEHRELTSWAKQGVLLLNTSLTVKLHEANSHGVEKIWKYYIEHVIRQISTQYPRVIFLLWGAHAKELAERADPVISKKSIKYKCGHPSGRNKNAKAESMFDDNGHFAAIYNDINDFNKGIYEKNKKLIIEGKEELKYVNQIDWSLTHEDHKKIQDGTYLNEVKQVNKVEVTEVNKVEVTEVNKVEVTEVNKEEVTEVNKEEVTEVNKEVNIVSEKPYQVLNYSDGEIKSMISQGYTIEQIKQYQNQCNEYYKNEYIKIQYDVFIGQGYSDEQIKQWSLTI